MPSIAEIDSTIDAMYILHKTKRIHFVRSLVSVCVSFERGHKSIDWMGSVTCRRNFTGFDTPGSKIIRQILNEFVEHGILLHRVIHKTVYYKPTDELQEWATTQSCYEEIRNSFS